LIRPDLVNKDRAKDMPGSGKGHARCRSRQCGDSLTLSRQRLSRIPGHRTESEAVRDAHWKCRPNSRAPETPTTKCVLSRRGCDGC